MYPLKYQLTFNIPKTHIDIQYDRYIDTLFVATSNETDQYGKLELKIDEICNKVADKLNVILHLTN